MTDFFQVVEFQQRGSPHIHMMAYVDDFETLFGKKMDVDHDSKVRNFIDQFITCSKTRASKENINGQTHTCRPSYCHRKKNKYTTCRFNYPQPPMDTTCILDPFSENEKTTHGETPKKDWKKTNEFLTTIPQTDEVQYTFENFLKTINLSKSQYVLALRIFLQRTIVFIKRATNELNINAYNKKCLEI